MVTNLIEKLFAHQFLKDISQDRPHTLLPEELGTYASNLAFIESFQTSAAYRFECFRNKQLLIIGSGLGFTSLVQASLQCGVRQINAIVTPEGEMGSSSRQDILDLFASRDSEQTVQLINAPRWDNEAEVRNTIQVYDAVLHISERPMLARAQLLNRLCVEEQKTFIQAILVGDHAWIGPLVCSESEGCWECAWRRLQANLTNLSEQLSHYELHDQLQASNSRFLALPEMTMIANRLIFALFKYFTQTGSPETKGQLSILHLETGLSENHAFLPHPHCQVCQHPVAPTAAQFLERVQQLQHLGPIDPDTFLERLAGSAVDTRLGIFTAIEGDDFVQAPLAVYKATLSNPMLQKNRPEILTIAAVSRDTEDTRLQAAQKACTRYAANLVDHRRLLPLEAVQPHTFPALSADQLVGMQSFSNQHKMWTWALDLQTQQACIVPAGHVFSALHQTESERGIASGMCWEEAICQALLDWCNYLTVEDLKDAQQAYFQVDLTRDLLTPEGIYLYQLLKTAVGQEILVYDVTGSLHVPTFATCFGEKVVAYSTHCDQAQALSIGFERALQQYQSEQCAQFEYAVAPVPDFPLTLRSNQLSVPRYTLPDAWPARQEWLLQRFQANGLRAFAVPLDHDPALVQVLPFIARVLLSRAESRKGE
jgi:bacteriocin biosynthesis cyclodehydratase domain-containing protein